MSWVVVGVAGGTALLSAYQADQKRKAQQQANQAQANISAAQAEFSPWTGMKPQGVDLQPLGQDALSAGIGGGLQGALGGAMFSKQNPSAPAPTMAPSQAPMMASPEAGSVNQGILVPGESYMARKNRSLYGY